MTPLTRTLGQAVVAALLFLAGMVLAGCSTGSLTGDMLLYGPFAGASVHGTDAKIAAGEIPPRGVLFRCGTADDRTACYAAAGWREVSRGQWERTTDAPH